MSHELQFRLTLSMSAVIPGHQTLELALEVMLETPPLLLWRASRTSDLRLVGTTTLSLYMITGAWADR